MFRTKKVKGFTIIELVIVIAVIAILSAILIPTFAGLVKKANISNDQVLVRQLNTCLKSSSSGDLDFENKTMYQTLNIMKKQGYSVDKLTPTYNNNDIVWDSLNNQFVLIYENGLTYTGTSVKPSTDKSKLWKIYDEMPDNSVYSIYLSGTSDVGDIEVNALGFDAGDRKTTTVTYINTSNDVKDVVIRTGGEELIVNGYRSSNVNENNECYGDTIKHYGWLDSLKINSVGDIDCYHEYGFVGEVKSFLNGKFIIEQGALFHQDKDAIQNIFNDESKKIIQLEMAKFNQHKYDENGICVILNCSGGLNGGKAVDDDLHHHDYEFIDNLDGKTHRVICKSCGNYYNEQHHNNDGKCNACDAILEDIKIVSATSTLTLSIGDIVKIKYTTSPGVKCWSLYAITSTGFTGQYSDLLQNEYVKITNIDVENSTATIYALKAGIQNVYIVYEQENGDRSSSMFTISISGTASTATIVPLNSLKIKSGEYYGSIQLSDSTKIYPSVIEHLVFGRLCDYEDSVRNAPYIIMDNSDPQKGSIKGYYVTSMTIDNIEYKNIFYILSESDMMFTSIKPSEILSSFPNVKTIDLGNLDFSYVSKAEDFKNMFSNVYYLEKIYVSELQVEQINKYDIANISLFELTPNDNLGIEPKLQGGLSTSYSNFIKNESHYDFSHKKGGFAKIDGGSSDPGYFTNRTSSPFYVA